MSATERAEIYERILNRLNAMQRHAQEKGDGVQADKCRKTKLDVIRLNQDEAEKEK